MLPTARAAALEAQVGQALTQLRAALAPQEAFNPASSRRVFHISGGDYAAMVILPALAAHLAQAAPLVNLRFRFIEKGAALCLFATPLELAPWRLAIIWPRKKTAILASPGCATC
jgi:DNA-binding transcriptional LysR family regulator